MLYLSLDGLLTDRWEFNKEYLKDWQNKIDIPVVTSRPVNSVTQYPVRNKSIH